MLILAIILALLSISISLFGLLYKPRIIPKGFLQGKPRLLVQKDKPKAKIEKEDLSLISKLESQINFLKTQLEKKNLDYSKIQNEFNELKEVEVNLKEELSKQIDWSKKKDDGLEKVKSDFLRLRDELMKKEAELENKISLNLNLSRELDEKKKISESLESQNRELIDKIRDLEFRISEYEESLKAKDKQIKEFQEKERESQWISKSQYLKLKRELEEKEKILERLQRDS